MGRMAILVVAVVTALCGCVEKTALTLVEKGEKRFRIVVAEDAIPAAKFAAKEVERCLGKDIAAPVGETPTVRIVVDKSLAEESYSIDVSKDGVVIKGADARGVLYGAYELLKRWGGMRWLAPGDDCEYCILGEKPTIEIPYGTYAHLPDLLVRIYSAATDEDYLWSARNNMQCTISWKNFSSDDTKPQNRRLLELGVYGHGRSGHTFSRLMGHDTENMQKLFEAHPEYFCLVKGKRVKSGLDCYGPNPCTSNQEVLDRMAETILMILEHPHGNEARTITLGNDDSMQWCECERCKALDPKEAESIPYGRRSDRYWWTVNEIAKRVWVKRPDAKLGGWAYQDFWKPPVKVKPDPRLALTISFNNQCWRHSMNDPACDFNRDMAELYRLWKPFGMRFTVNRNEFHCEGTPGGTFAPAEYTLVKSFKEAEALGCFGQSFAGCGPYPDPLPWELKHPERYPPYKTRNMSWWACWQSHYIAARQMWDRTRDVDSELEEANRLMYGSAWEGGMKEFRDTQVKAFYATPGCQRWAVSATIAKCLDVPGAEKTMRAALKRALETAAKDPDPRVLKNVQRVEFIFTCTWLQEREKYLKQYQEYEFYAVTNGWNKAAPVTIGENLYLKGAYSADALELKVYSKEPLEIIVKRPGLKWYEKKVVADGRDVKIDAKDLGGKLLDGTSLIVLVTNKPLAVTLRPRARVESMTLRERPVWSYGAMDQVDKKNGGPVGWNNPKNAAKSVLYEGSSDDYYTRLGTNAAEVGYSYYLPKAHVGSYRITCRARGRGQFRMWSSSYHYVGGINGYNAIVDGSGKNEVKNLTDDWQTYSMETKSVGKEMELLSIRFFRLKDGEFDIDDVYVEPME